MEENTNTQNTTINPNPVVNTVSNDNSVITQKFSKKKIITIFVIVIVLIGLGIGYYFYMKKPVEPYIPTLEEKVNAVEETVNKTKELGLPPVKKQVEIMNYNLQN